MTLLAGRPMLRESLASSEGREFSAFTTARTDNAKRETSIRSRLADAEWDRIVNVLPCRMQARARNNGNARTFVEAVLWVASTNLYWKSMPEEYGDPHTNYMRFVRWAHAGIWDEVLSAMEESTESSVRLNRLVDSYRTKSTMMNVTRALPATGGKARVHGGSDQRQESVHNADHPQHGYSGNA